ncbi:MAG: hypothetical protein RLZZ450_4433 [Pseudomonadota bacterium]|jgi:hypothetical protein
MKVLRGVLEETRERYVNLGPRALDAGPILQRTVGCASGIHDCTQAG